MKRDKWKIKRVESWSEVGHRLADAVGAGWNLFGFDPGFSYTKDVHAIVTPEDDDATRLHKVVQHWQRENINIDVTAAVDILRALGQPAGYCGLYQCRLPYLGDTCPVCGTKGLKNE